MLRSIPLHRAVLLASCSVGVAALSAYWAVPEAPGDALVLMPRPPVRPAPAVVAEAPAPENRKAETAPAPEPLRAVAAGKAARASVASKGLLKVLGAEGHAMADVGGASGMGTASYGFASGVGGLGVSGTGTGAGGGVVGRGATGRSMPRGDVSPLKAGATDDNADFTEFIRFRQTWEKKGIASADYLDVRGRSFIRVVDEDGVPVPGARVQVSDDEADRSTWTATTYGDGRAPFYPRIARVTAGQEHLSVEAWLGDRRARTTWDGGTDLSIVLEGDVERARRRADVLFVLDTTGSMGDEIDRIKATLLNVNAKLKHLGQDADLRYGAVLFRDRGDEYVTRELPFTSDVAAFSAALQEVQAGGGGDEPESVNEALATAVRAKWRKGAARIMFLVGDAPPHLDYARDTPYHRTLQRAVEEGIRVHAVAASGLNPVGTLVWRQVAQFTRGKFIFIEYGSLQESAAAHGVTGQVTTNNLDAIILREVEEELRGWGRPDGEGRVAQR